MLWATLWFLVFGIGVLIYIFYYMAKTDEIVYLEVGPDGAIVDYGRPQPNAGFAQTMSAETQAVLPVGAIRCPSCGKALKADRRFCAACGYEFKPDELMKRGIEACKSGRDAEARDLLRQVIRQDDVNEKAWLWLSDAVQTDREREECLQHVLSINPSNAIARRGLDILNERKPTRPKTSRTRWVVLGVLAVAAALALGSFAAYLLLYLTAPLPPQAPGPAPVLDKASQASDDAPKPLPTLTPSVPLEDTPISAATATPNPQAGVDADYAECVVDHAMPLIEEIMAELNNISTGLGAEDWDMVCRVVPDWTSSIKAARTAFEACGEPSSALLVDAKRNCLAALEEDSMAAASMTDFCETYPSPASQAQIDEAARHGDRAILLYQTAVDALTRYGH